MPQALCYTQSRIIILSIHFQTYINTVFMSLHTQAFDHSPISGMAKFNENAINKRRGNRNDVIKIQIKISYNYDVII